MAISRFFGFPRKAVNAVFHASSSLTNKNYQEARRRIREVAKTQAEELSLANLKLTTLPPELFRLAHLQSLRLSGNQLQEFPPEICRLTQLEKLYASRTLLKQGHKETLGLRQFHHSLTPFKTTCEAINK